MTTCIVPDAGTIYPDSVNNHGFLNGSVETNAGCTSCEDPLGSCDEPTTLIKVGRDTRFGFHGPSGLCKHSTVSSD